MLALYMLHMILPVGMLLQATYLSWFKAGGSWGWWLMLLTLIFGTQVAVEGKRAS